tara:strand:- start:1966 stop:2139 length:174 start_codon:yes stop_codon:yes gene_type:complete
MKEKILTKKDLITKYQKELDEMIIMDDFDAGKATSMRIIIEDLKGTICNEADKELDY